MARLRIAPRRRRWPVVVVGVGLVGAGAAVPGLTSALPTGDAVRQGVRAEPPPVSDPTTRSLAIDEAEGRELRVVLVGDSLAEGLLPELEAHVEAAVPSVVTGDTHGSTGLARADVLDWPAEVAGIVDQRNPDVVVVLVGANDLQSVQLDGTWISYGAPGWEEAYGERVDDVLAAATAGGAAVYWVGLPPMQPPHLASGLPALNRIVAERVEPVPSAAVIPSTTVLAGPDAAYTPTVPGPDGTLVRVREGDGVHLTPVGASLLADAIAARLVHDLGAS